MGFLGNVLLSDWSWTQYPFHALAEGMGAFCAFVLVGMLLILRAYGQLAPHYLWVLCALIGMGILDLFHAATYAGPLFVWLHSMASLVGGAFFACVWLPDSITRRRWVQSLPSAMMLAALLLGVGSVAYPGMVPAMLNEQGFTPLAKAINMLGGLGFLVASVRFGSYKGDMRSGATLAFANHCLIFGIAGLLFERSVLWDFNWWLWHALRLMAYAIVLAYFFNLYKESQKKLRESHDELERRVKQRTTELQGSETRSRAYAAELARSNRELQDFAYVSSHDLQEPLRKIQAFGDRLNAHYADVLDAQGQDYLRRMQSAAARSQELINALLAYSRVTTKGQPFASVDLAKLAGEVLDDLEVRIEKSGGVVALGDLPVIDGDASQLRQLLQNLIGNALKYHPEGAPPYVEVTANIKERPPSGELCELTVADRGIGFDEKYLDRIFTPFQRLHGRGEYEGTGMGLAICKKIVSRHGGTITAESAPGRGARFLVELPAKHPAGEERP